MAPAPVEVRGARRWLEGPQIVTAQCSLEEYILQKRPRQRKVTVGLEKNDSRPPQWYGLG